ncbi:MAG: chromosomal replication initiator protein DnaA [Candidatus Cloacimonetes bacterium]|nr:chromosomal replication initiator protein DnaA [Candidatus Cloacimonadota bacterium]
MKALNNLWKKILIEVKSQVDEQTYKTWFNKTHQFSFVNNTLTIKTQTKFFADWLDQHYKNILEEIAYNLTENKIEINFIGTSNQQTKKSIEDNIDFTKKTGLNPEYTFARFIKGKNNSFAASASIAVAENPGKSYNPLFIYGGYGLGKTHLIESIGNFVLNKNGGKKVAYISGEDFLNQMVLSIQTNTTLKFRKKFRGFDVLIIDDIHFISGKDSSQDEFFNTFNKLYNAKKQIVLASDRPPNKIKNLQDRLISRFEWGILAEIKRPVFETRVAIINQKCEEEKLSLKREVIDYIAENFESSIRQLEGALHKIFAYASYQKIKTGEVKLETTKELIADLINSQKSLITLNSIQEEVAKYFNLGKNQIKKPTRKKEIAFPRQIAMYLSTKYLNDISLLEIAHHYNKKDHTTIIHAKKTIQKKIDNNPTIKAKIDEISENITQNR